MKKQVNLEIKSLPFNKHQSELENLSGNLIGYITEKESLTTLKEELSLSKLPKHIECFDIPHISGSFAWLPWFASSTGNLVGSNTGCINKILCWKR